MRSNWTRRAFLAGVGTSGLVGLAGCAVGPGSSRGATDVVVHNEGAERRTVDLLVTKRNGESANIDASFALEPNSQKTINNEVIMGANYDVEVAVTSPAMESPYTETQEWNDAGQSLHVILNEQIVFAIEIG